jgi:hypothetical protein
MRNSCNVFSGGRKRQGSMRVSPCQLLCGSSFSSGAGGECIRFAKHAGNAAAGTPVSLPASDRAGDSTVHLEDYNVSKSERWTPVSLPASDRAGDSTVHLKTTMPGTNEKGGLLTALHQILS